MTDQDLKDTLCSHFPSSKIVNLGRFNFQLEPITISREVFLAITEPGVTVPASSHWLPLTASLTKQRKIKTNVGSVSPAVIMYKVRHISKGKYEIQYVYVLYMIRHLYNSCTLTYLQHKFIWYIMCFISQFSAFSQKLHIMALIILNSVLYIVVLLATINAWKCKTKKSWLFWPACCDNSEIVVASTEDCWTKPPLRWFKLSWVYITMCNVSWENV